MLNELFKMEDHRRDFQFPALGLLCLKFIYQMYFKMAIVFSKKETKLFLDIFEGKVKNHNLGEDKLHSREPLYFWFSLLNQISHVIPLRNFLLTRTASIEHILQTFRQTNSFVINHLTRMDISDEVEFLLSQQAILDNLDVSCVIKAPLENELPDMAYICYSLQCYIMDTPVRQRPEDEKVPLMLNVHTLLGGWLKEVEDGEELLDSRSQRSSIKEGPNGSERGLRSMRSLSVVSGVSGAVEAHGSRKYIDEKHKIENENKKKHAVLSRLNQVLMYLTSVRIHQEIGILSSLVMMIGNFYCQTEHISVQKYFYDPKLLACFIELKSNKFSRDLQYLSFTLLTTVPSEYLERRINTKEILQIIISVLELKQSNIENYKQRGLSTFIANLAVCRFMDKEKDLIYSFKVLFV